MSDLKKFATSRPSASNFKSFSQSLEHFFLTVGQNNYVNKIPSLLGVINVVTCQHGNASDVGKAMCDSPDVGVMSFTGSSRVGK